jgi:2,3,4,5-tetrahydropyridine-2-carboxylate N-succinyltransferase
MNYYAVGFRRSRQEIALDVTYPIILKDDKTYNELKKVLDIQSPGVHRLSSQDYVNCRDLAFLDLPLGMTSDKVSYMQVDPVFFALDDLNAEIQSTEDAYFRLQLLSQRLVKPHEQNLSGLFAHLPNIAWTNHGPVLPEDVPVLQAKAMLMHQNMVVTHVDKFPYMVNYHIPKGVRIADASRVRLGAYLGEGTTIMPAGFVNFNAGTLGNAMVEGRVSAGVIVGEDSDVGGGASIMGTLSGGNDHVISVGKKCLLGANSGIGISLGDGCTVGAGVYVTAGKKVTLLNTNNEPVDPNGNPVPAGQNIVKAAELSGSDYRLFIEDSQTGELICKPNTKVIQLNEALHSNA